MPNPKLTNARRAEQMLHDLREQERALKMMLHATKQLIATAAEVFEAYEADAQDSLREQSAYQSLLDAKQQEIDELTGTLAEAEAERSNGAWDANDFGAPKVGAL